MLKQNTNMVKEQSKALGLSSGGTFSRVPSPTKAARRSRRLKQKEQLLKSNETLHSEFLKSGDDAEIGRVHSSHLEFLNGNTSESKMFLMSTGEARRGLEDSNSKVTFADKIPHSHHSDVQSIKTETDEEGRTQRAKAAEARLIAKKEKKMQNKGMRIKSYA